MQFRLGEFKVFANPQEPPRTKCYIKGYIKGYIKAVIEQFYNYQRSLIYSS